MAVQLSAIGVPLGKTERTVLGHLEELRSASVHHNTRPSDIEISETRLHRALARLESKELIRRADREKESGLYTLYGYTPSLSGTMEARLELRR